MNGKKSIIYENSISVIIPMYNAEQTIKRTLISVLEQTFEYCIKEVIIINDGSTDGSESIVKGFILEYKVKNYYIYNKVNGGVSSARNYGMKIATSKWIALLDADDVWLNCKIEKQILAVKSNPNIDFIGGGIDDKKFKILFRTINSLYKVELNDLLIKVFPQTSTVIFKRKIFLEIGGFDENQHYGEDVNYFMKICTKYGCFFYPEKMIIYDSGKRGFGVRGLSANLIEMHRGEIKNLRELYTNRIISYNQYFFFRIYYLLKYYRRKIITKVNRIERE